MFLNLNIVRPIIVYYNNSIDHYYHVRNIKNIKRRNISIDIISNTINDNKFLRSKVLSLLLSLLYHYYNHYYYYSLWLVDVAFLASLGRGHLASAALGTSIYLMVWSFLEGILTAQDTLSTHSYGMGDIKQVRYWLYISIIVSLIYCIIATIIFIFARIITITLLFVNYHIASKAALHIIILIPSFWFLTLYRIEQKFLQSQNIMIPVIYCNIIGNIINILLNYLLMFPFGIGFIGCAISTSLTRFIMFIIMTYYVIKNTNNKIIYNEITYIVGDRTVGCLTSSLAQLSMIGSKIENWFMEKVLDIKPDTNKRNNDNNGEVEMNSLLHSEGNNDDNDNDDNDNDDDDNNDNNDNDSKSKSNISINDIELDSIVDTKLTMKKKDDNQRSLKYLRKNFSMKKLIMGSLRFALMGIPGGLMMILETWYLDLTVIFIVHIGSVALSAHIILLTITSFWYIVVPFAISTAVTVRLGNLLGAGSHKRGRIASFVAILLGFCAMALVGAIVYVMSRYIGKKFFTNDIDVLFRMEELAPFVALFSICQGVHTCAAGVLRAIGKQKVLAVLNLVFLNIIGLGAAIFLAFIVRPTYGLDGFWYGILIGVGCLLFSLLLLVVGIDWELEVKRALYRLDRLRGVDGSAALPMPRPGSRAVGGLDLFTESGYDELNETENIMNQNLTQE